MSRIELKHIDKFYGSNHVLRDINLVIEDGDFMTLLGPSGCGKTTTLRVVSGLEKPQSGYMTIDGREVINCDDAFYEEPSKRGLNLVFQSYALWPHMTVYDNIAFGLKIKKMAKAEIDKAVGDSLKMLRIEQFADRYPNELSGGQQQRVAIARAIASKPRLLLLDEPLSNLDAKLRIDMRSELKRLHLEMGTTIIYVTHDQEEALTMSDKIVVMAEGKMQQIGTPEDIYNEPANAFVADFIGDSNIFNGIMTGKLKARFCGGEFACVDDFEEGTHITAVVRPEDVLLTEPGQGKIRGIVTSVIFKGMHYEITIESGKNEIIAQSVNSAAAGDRVGIYVEPDNIHIMLAEDHTNIFAAEINRNYELEYNGKVLDVQLTDLIKGSRLTEDGTLLDGNGLELDRNKLRIKISIKPTDIELTDEQEEGLVQGYISNLIYKGDHYSYVIHTDLEQDFVVNDEYLWNMEDQVGLLMPVDKMVFTVKK